MKKRTKKESRESADDKRREEATRALINLLGGPILTDAEWTAPPPPVRREE